MIEVLPLFQNISDELILLRSDIVQLEKIHCDNYADYNQAAFSAALLDFAEWDDHSRPSYVRFTQICVD